MSALAVEVDPVPTVDPARVEKFRWYTASVLTGLFGFALYDQTALPAVAAALQVTGRAENDPWGRAIRTAAADQLTFWGSESDRDAEWDRIRKLHHDVHGAAPDGTKYHAYTPENWNWILMSTFFFFHNAYTPITGEPLTADDDEVFWQYFKDATAGLHLGGPAVLPATYPQVVEHYEWMVANRLESTDLLRNVVAILLNSPRPGFWPSTLAPLWPVAGPAIGHVLAVLSFGIMHDDVREMTGFGWSRRHDAEFFLLTRGVRLAYRYLPKRLQYSPMAYHRWRLEQTAATYREAGLESFTPDQSFTPEQRRAMGCPA